MSEIVNYVNTLNFFLTELSIAFILIQEFSLGVSYIAMSLI